MALEDGCSTASFLTSHEGKLPKQLCWRQGSKHWWCARAQRVRCSCNEVTLQPSWWEPRLQRPAQCILFTCQSKASPPGALIIPSSVPCTWPWRQKLERGEEILFPKCQLCAGSSAEHLCGLSHLLLPILQMRRSSPSPIIGKVVLGLMG